MNKYLQLIKQGQLIFQDGGFGTMLQKHKITSEDFHGHEGAFEYLNISRPDIIQDVHKQYLLAGAMVMDTNSFGGNRIKLKEYGLEHKVYEINYAAAQNAQKAIQALNFPNTFVMGSMGPTGFLPSSTDPSLGSINFDELSNVFEEQATALIDGGADLILLETQHDILEVKAGIIGAKKAITNSCKEIALQVQVTVDQYSNMLFGTHILTAITIIKDMGIDVFGINCSTGPREMENTIKLLSEHSPLPISIIPNAGMPENIDGTAHYKMTPELFSTVIGEYLRKYRISVVGGCCGTTPEHIGSLKLKAESLKLKAENLKFKAECLPSFCGPISLAKEKKTPLIIGERINSQGSRKAKELMLQDKYDELVDLAKSQEQSNADLIDCCFAMTERADEEDQLSFFAKKVAYATTIPLCFDSTEAITLESAVKSYAGKPLINSINLESDKIHQILPIVKNFGLSTIALCIDEQGMAKTTKEKLTIAKKIYKIAVNDYGLKPEQLIFDTLTFTLATGEEEWRNSAKETFNAIQLLKKELPGVKTVLGVSNVSFGLTPPARKILNLVYLHTAVEYGLDMAIFNADHFQPLSELNKNEANLAKNLILNKSSLALTEFIEHFQKTETQKTPTSTNKPAPTTNLPLDKLIQHKIITRDKEGIIDLLEKLRQTMKAEEIINTVLLPAMKVVGDKMETGEIILPFVLESAEIMKKSITHLEKYLDKNSNMSKGTIVLATVYGDVHDIGKNLVKTITENNGYKVIDLGKQVPADKIIETALKEKADAITLSALLVTTSKQMQLIVEKLHNLDKSIPVIIGGAAINSNYAKTISNINGTPYKGGVYYSKDAFTGLKILEDIINVSKKNN